MLQSTSRPFSLPPSFARKFISQEKRLGTRQPGELIFAGEIVVQFPRRTRDALVTNTYPSRRFCLIGRKYFLPFQKQISNSSLQGCDYHVITKSSCLDSSTFLRNAPCHDARGLEVRLAETKPEALTDRKGITKTFSDFCCKK